MAGWGGMLWYQQVFFSNISWSVSRDLSTRQPSDPKEFQNLAWLDMFFLFHLLPILVWIINTYNLFPLLEGRAAESQCSAQWVPWKATSLTVTGAIPKRDESPRFHYGVAVSACAKQGQWQQAQHVTCQGCSGEVQVAGGALYQSLSNKQLTNWS